MISIRPYQAQDAGAVFEAAMDSLAEMEPWMPWCHPALTRDDIEKWVALQITAFAEATAFEFAIVGEDDRYLGGCGVNAVDRDNLRANLGYWVRTSATGRGVATEAVRQLVRWAREKTALNRLEVVISVDNLRSLRVAEKTGALREGVLRSRIMLHGRPHDAAVFAFVRGINME